MGPQTQQDYWDLGSETERWWRAHVKVVMPHIRHIPKCKGYDFKGEVEGQLTYIDAKFLTVPYRTKGWIEIKSWGKVTGIMETGKEHFYNPQVDVLLAVMTEEHHYLYDVKAIIRDIQSGVLPMHKTIMTDSMGNQTEGVNVVINGWDDERYMIISGWMDEAKWKPKTAFGKQMDVDAWFAGNGI